MNEQETHAEVIAEMRGAKTEFPFVYLMGEPDTPEIVDVTTKKIMVPRKINIRRVTVQELAGRLEAARKRERGDCAKLREALQKAEESAAEIMERVRHKDGLAFNTANYIASTAKDALAAPPRNCDVGTANDQAERYGRYCDKFTLGGMHCETCPCRGKIQFGKCEFAWAQMPYEEGVAR